MRRKVIFYGAIELDDSFDGYAMDIADAEGTLREQLETLLQNCGYTADVHVHYEENSLDVSNLNPEKRPKLLIDAHNIDWSGLHYTGAFAESLEFVLNRQKTYEPEVKARKYEREETYSGYCGDYDYCDPCDGCSEMLCAECLYSGV